MCLLREKTKQLRATESINIGGHAYGGQNRRYVRHLKVNPNAALVVDDLVTDATWAPRGVTVEGLTHRPATRGKSLSPRCGSRRIELLPDRVAGGVVTPALSHLPSRLAGVQCRPLRLRRGNASASTERGLHEF